MNNDLNEEEEFVDIGGYLLHVRIMGVGKPTVVFESGLGDEIDVWKQIQPVLAGFTRTLAYDRAGLGGSGASPHPRTISFMVDDLYSLLTKVDVIPPYIFVAHSLGGLIVRMFAHRYPDLVKGLVLVDPTHEDFPRLMAELRTPEQWSTFQKQMDDLAIGAPAGALAENQQWQQGIEKMAEVVWVPNLATTILTSIRFDEDTRQMGMIPEDKELWLQLHTHWLTHIPSASHIVTQKSGHYIHVEEPELVINAVREMI